MAGDYCDSKQSFPNYVLQFCQDGVFPHDNPCVTVQRWPLLVWQYEKLFIDIHCPCASARKHSKGSLQVCKDQCSRCLATANEHVVNVGYGCMMIEKAL